jgi:hypothetical protein
VEEEVNMLLGVEGVVEVLFLLLPLSSSDDLEVPRLCPCARRVEREKGSHRTPSEMFSAIKCV